MFAHITPAFLSAAATLFGVMVMTPHLRSLAAKRQNELDKIQPYLTEVQDKWKAVSGENPEWRKLMNQELMAVWKAHGLSPWGGVKSAALELGIYLLMWIILIVAAADMVVRYSR